MPENSWEWRKRAKCAGWPIDLFTMDNETPKARTTAAQRQEIASVLCEKCPVIRECARDALHHRDVGIIRAATWLPLSPSYQVRARLREIAEGVIPPSPRPSVQQMEYPDHA